MCKSPKNQLSVDVHMKWGIPRFKRGKRWFPGKNGDFAKFSKCERFSEKVLKNHIYMWRSEAVEVEVGPRKIQLSFELSRVREGSGSTAASIRSIFGKGNLVSDRL